MKKINMKRPKSFSILRIPTNTNYRKKLALPQAILLMTILVVGVISMIEMNHPGYGISKQQLQNFILWKNKMKYLDFEGNNK